MTKREDEVVMRMTMNEMGSVPTANVPVTVKGNSA
jgi:hypothetical protein